MTSLNLPEKFSPDGRIRSINPRSWEIVGSVETTALDSLPGLIAQARSAQESWAGRSPRERAQVLAPALERVVARKDELAALIGQEHGKSTTEAMFSEVLGTAEVLRVHMKEDPRWLRSNKVKLDPLSYPGKRARVDHLPRGVVAVVMPWNYPLALPMRTIVPALIAGNAVVFKPSEHSVLVGAAIGELFDGILPEGLLQVIQGGAELGAALSSSPALDGIVFTGSVSTGRKVAQSAAVNLVPVSLELGGKDAAIVCSDADLERSAQGIAWAAFHNSGQNCAGLERVYVEDSIYERFVDKLVIETKKLRTSGDPDCVEVGPLCTEAQFSIVQQQLHEAVAAGARVLCGGEATGEGWVIEPTVLVDVPENCAVWSDETFGPLLPVMRIHSVYEGVDRCNASPFGLSVSVWGEDVGRAEAIARRCEVGMTLVNNHSFNGSLPHAPWVGVKQSGSGVTGSPLAMKFLTRPQLVLVDRNKLPEVWWFPLNKHALAMGRTLLSSLVASGFNKLTGMFGLLGLLKKRWK